jgi:hypothetical protein
MARSFLSTFVLDKTLPRALSLIQAAVKGERAERYPCSQSDDRLSFREGIAMIKTKFLLTILLLFSFDCATPKLEQKQEWNGKIETENGVNVIKNPKQPLYGDLKLKLKEDLSIGGADDKNYSFNRVRGIAVDNQGNIYAVDMSNQRVQIFDQKGKYLKTIPEIRKGPGAFQQPYKILLDENTGNIYVSDGPKIKVFDREGQFVVDIIPKAYPVDFIITGDGAILAKTSSGRPDEATVELTKINLKSEALGTYASFPFYNIMLTKIDGMGSGSGYSGLEHDLLVVGIDQQTCLYGYSKEYELNVVDSQGKLLFKIEKDAPYQNITPGEQDEYKKKAVQITKKLRAKYKDIQVLYNLPEHWPCFYNLLTDSEKRIYVQTNHTRSKLEVDNEVDILSPEGYYLYKTVIPHFTRVIKNGFLYTTFIDEKKAVEYVKRFKIKNWEQIRAGI